MKDVKKLRYFVGRPCTVFTTPINRNYREENPNNYVKQMINYFVGIVEVADEDGVVLKHLNDPGRTFFLMEHVVGIAEEQVLNPDKEDDRRVIDKLRSAPPPPVVQNQLIDPSSLSAMLKDLGGRQ